MSIVGTDEETAQEFIKRKEKKDRLIDQLSLFG